MPLSDDTPCAGTGADPISSARDDGRLVGADAVTAAGVPFGFNDDPTPPSTQTTPRRPVYCRDPFSHIACILSVDPNDAISSFFWLKFASTPQDLGDGDGTATDTSALEVAKVTSLTMAELLEHNPLILASSVDWFAVLRILPRPILCASAEHSLNDILANAMLLSRPSTPCPCMPRCLGGEAPALLLGTRST